MSFEGETDFDLGLAWNEVAPVEWTYPNRNASRRKRCLSHALLDRKSSADGIYVKISDGQCRLHNAHASVGPAKRIRLWPPHTISMSLARYFPSLSKHNKQSETMIGWLIYQIRICWSKGATINLNPGITLRVRNLRPRKFGCLGRIPTSRIRQFPSPEYRLISTVVATSADRSLGLGSVPDALWNVIPTIKVDLLSNCHKLLNPDSSPPTL